MYKKILVTTDGSKGARSVKDHAMALASSFSADVSILYVIDVRSGPQGMSELVTETFKSIGEEAIDELEREFEEMGVEAEGYVEYGIPHQTILNFADENSIDLIVMSTHGRTGLDRFLIGSVTEKVVRKSKKPVLTVGRTD